MPERLRGVFTTRRYTNPHLPLPINVMGLQQELFTDDDVTLHRTIYKYLCRNSSSPRSPLDLALWSAALYVRTSPVSLKCIASVERRWLFAIPGRCRLQTGDT